MIDHVPEHFKHKYGKFSIANVERDPSYPVIIDLFHCGLIIPGDQKLMFSSRLVNLSVHDLRLRDPLS